MILRLNLGKYLKEHDISAYRLVQEVKGEVAPNTVYDLARSPAVRVNLRVVAKILEALSRVRGAKVSVIEVIDEIEEEAAPAALPTLEQLLARVPLPDLTGPKFRYGGVRVQPRQSGPPAEAIIAQLRGHE